MAKGQATEQELAERLVAAHATMQAAVAELRSSDDWASMLRLAGSLHRYSPHNRIFLAAQGAAGQCASYAAWAKIPAVGGGMCQVRPGVTALRVFAPIRTSHHEPDDETGEEQVTSRIVGWKLVPVFHEGQLKAPPDWPARPKPLTGDFEGIERVWAAVESQIVDAGFTVHRAAMPVGLETANGFADHATRRVVVRPDLEPIQAIRTGIHELAHVLMHAPTDAAAQGLSREVREIEAESVAYLVTHMLGVDASGYTIPYVAHWLSGHGIDAVKATAERTLATTTAILSRLGSDLGIELAPDIPGLTLRADETLASPEPALSTVVEPVEPRPPATAASLPVDEAGMVTDIAARAGADPAAAFELAASSGDIPVGVFAGLIDFYGLAPTDAATHLHDAGIDVERATIAVVTSSDSQAAALRALVAVFPDRSADEWTALAHQAGVNVEPSVIASVTIDPVGARLIEEWARVRVTGGTEPRGQEPWPVVADPAVA